jgi:hypothetical protein
LKGGGFWEENLAGLPSVPILEVVGNDRSSPPFRLERERLGKDM